MSQSKKTVCFTVWIWLDAKEHEIFKPITEWNITNKMSFQISFNTQLINALSALLSMCLLILNLGFVESRDPLSAERRHRQLAWIQEIREKRVVHGISVFSVIAAGSRPRYGLVHIRLVSTIREALQEPSLQGNHLGLTAAPRLPGTHFQCSVVLFNELLRQITGEIIWNSKARENGAGFKDAALLKPSCVELKYVKWSGKNIDSVESS